jgi:hypothetical protein
MKRKGRLITVNPKKPVGRVWPQNVQHGPRASAKVPL